MRIVVTRVQPQADAWVHQLCAQQLDAVAMPLIEVQGLDDVTAVQTAGTCWSDYRAVMFVSHHAVRYFFKENKPLAQVIRALVAIKTRAWVTGPGSTKAWLSEGLPAACLDAPAAQSGQFDSEALWQRVQHQVCPGDRVLIVRGCSQAANSPPGTDEDAGVGRDWLAAQLRQARVGVDFVVAYQRGAPLWNATQRALAQAAAVDGSVWLLSSAEAVGHLATLLPDQDWTHTRAVATHERIAQAARALGMCQVLQARPVLADVVKAINGLGCGKE